MNSSALSRWSCAGVVAALAVAAAAVIAPGAASASVTTYAVTDTFAVGDQPFSVAVDPGTRTAYVPSFNSGTVKVVDETTDTVTATVPVGTHPFGAAVDPSTHVVYVANFGAQTVSVIDGATDTVTANIAVGKSPAGVAVDSELHRVYVTNNDGDSMSVIDTTTNAVVATTTIAGGPLGVTVDPTTHTIYVADGYSSNVSVVSGATRAVVATIQVGGRPFQTAFDPVLHAVYVANFNYRDIDVIDTRTNQVTDRIPLEGAATGVSIDPGTHTLYAVLYDRSKVSVIDATTNTVLTTLGVGDTPYWAGVDPTTHLAYVANKFGNSVSVIGGSSPPVVTSLSPDSGTPAGGHSVTVTGTDFTGATGVYFGDAAATSYTVDSPTQITATAPAHDGTGNVDVTVTTPAGTSSLTENGVYSYAKYFGSITTAATGAVTRHAITVSASVHGADSPGGQMQFELYGPDDRFCNGTPMRTDYVALDNGSAMDSAVVYTPGDYRWSTVYSGDDNNYSNSTTCNAVSTVTADPTDHLVVSPSTATIAAGDSGTYTAEAFDAAGNDLGDATADTTFTIDPDGSCFGATCTATAAGSHTVTATDGSATGTAALTVTAGLLDHLVPSSPADTIVAGGSATYTAEGFDSYDNDLGDDTANATFSIDGGSCTGSSCTTTSAVTHVVTAVDGTASGTAVIQVLHGAFAGFYATTSAGTPLAAGTSRRFGARAYDAYGNIWATDPARTAFAESDGRCVHASCSSTVAGHHSVEVTFAHHTESIAVMVVPARFDHIVLTPATGEAPAGKARTFQAIAQDRYGNRRGSVGAATAYTIDDGTCDGATCSATDPGQHTVTATYGGSTATATLTVAGATPGLRFN